MNRTSSNSAAAPHTVLFCTPNQWTVAVVAGLAFSALAFPWYHQVSYWVGPILLLMVMTAGHMVFSSRLITPFPHISILIAGLQYGVGPWLSFYFPSGNSRYDIGEQLPRYLAYGSGCTIAVALGWAVVLYGTAGRRCPAVRSPPRLLAELDVLFWSGLLCGGLARFIGSPSLGFLLVLCANLRYVGALGRMLANGQGWQWRVGLTLGIEMLLATKGGMFHSLLLWGMSVFVLYLYRFRPKPLVVGSFFLMGLLLLPAFHESKWRLRASTWKIDTAESRWKGEDLGGGLNTAFSWLSYLAQGLWGAATLSMDKAFLADTIVRYNQGWIINQVMNVVPDEEPYAKGETLVTAAKAALMPRLLAPEKYSAGGKLHMARFAGMEMEGTSMNLGFAGEMYANFGYSGGVAGCFVYAALLGLGFRWVASRASRSPLWWVFLPYVASITFKAEDGIAEVLNWLVKATIVAVAVYWSFPAIRANLSGRTEPREITASSPRPKRGIRPRLGDRGQGRGILSMESGNQKVEMEEQTTGGPKS